MRYVLLLVAAFIAIGVGVFTLQVSGKKNEPSPVAQATQDSSQVTTVEVLVARQAIDVGTIIEEPMIDRQPWPSHLVLDGFITTGSPNSNLVGKVARAPLQAREPFMASKVANPNDPSFLAAALPAGMRAVTIATDAVSGVAGYLFPGDRVDVLLTHNIPQELRNKKQNIQRYNERPQITETLISNVRVLAVNVRESSVKEAAKTVSIPTNVTLEVNRYGAQRLRLAEKQGTLSLSLRSIKDGNQNDPARPTVSRLLTRMPVRGVGVGDEIRIVRGVGESRVLTSGGGAQADMAAGTGDVPDDADAEQMGNVPDPAPLPAEPANPDLANP